MMTSMYPTTRHQYFREPPRVYINSNVAIKNEPVDDPMESHCPVDMSLSGHHQNRRGCVLAPSTTLEKGPFYESYLLAPQQQNESHHPSLLRLSESKQERRTSSNCEIQNRGPEEEGFQIKGNDGKLTVPAMLSKTGRSSGFRVLDLHSISAHQRAKREFVPDEKKDEGYWCKRLKNNDSARRSRVKRKALEKMMETRLLELQKENIELRHEMAALKKRFGVDEGLSSDNDTSTHSRITPLSPSYASSSGQDERVDKEDDDLDVQSSDDSQSNDDSRVYSMSNLTALNQSLRPTGRYRTHSIASGSSAETGSRSSFTSGSESRNSGHLESGMRVDKSGALDLTNDASNRSTPGRDSSSPEGYSSSSQSERRCSWQNNETSGQEMSCQNQIRSFPLKCRWKKEMHIAQNATNEEMP